jgi:hypothetical protein
MPAVTIDNSLKRNRREVASSTRWFAQRCVTIGQMSTYALFQSYSPWRSLIASIRERGDMDDRYRADMTVRCHIAARICCSPVLWSKKQGMNGICRRRSVPSSGLKCYEVIARPQLGVSNPDIVCTRVRCSDDKQNSRFDSCSQFLGHLFQFSRRQSGMTGIQTS